MKARNATLLSPAAQFAQGLEALAAAGPVEPVIAEVASGRIDLASLASRGPQSPVEQALLTLAGAVDEANALGAKLSLPQWFERITGRAPGALTPVAVSNEEAAQRLAAASQKLPAIGEHAKRLYSYGKGYAVVDGHKTYDGAAIDALTKAEVKKMRAVRAELAQQLGPLDAAKRAGQLDPVAAAKLNAVLVDVSALVRSVQVLGLPI